jgi:predicted DNA-binding transcriptional regulator AlpA
MHTNSHIPPKSTPHKNKRAAHVKVEPAPAGSPSTPTERPMLTIAPELEPLWDIRSAAAYLSVSPKTIEKLRHSGSFPAAIVIGRTVRWEPLVIRAWALTQKETTVNTGQVAA